LSGYLIELLGFIPKESQMPLELEDEKNKYTILEMKDKVIKDVIVQIKDKSE
jgi:putative hemolysin